MGLGGYLTWTAVAEEIRKIAGHPVKFLPIEQHGSFIKLIYNEVFDHNKNFIQEMPQRETGYIIPLVLNNPAANYCKNDTPDRAYQRGDRHIIEQCCEVYGIKTPTLKCYLDLTSQELNRVDDLIQTLIGKDDFITIEPNSKDNYTPNRAYSFNKWQSVVDALKDKIRIVQVGGKEQPVLQNVIDMTGKTSFSEAAGLIGRSKLFLSSEGGLVHAASAVNTKSIVIITGYQTEKMVAYPQNININISRHGPCGLKVVCPNCLNDVENHDWNEIVNKVYESLSWKI